MQTKLQDRSATIQESWTGISAEEQLASVEIIPDQETSLKVDGVVGSVTLSTHVLLLRCIRANDVGSSWFRQLTRRVTVPRPAFRLGDPAGANGENYAAGAASNLGYSVSADGVFGALTQAAVILFQRNNKLTADGVAGSKTLAKLYSGSAAGPGDGGGSGGDGSDDKGSDGGDSGSDRDSKSTSPDSGYSSGSYGTTSGPRRSVGQLHVLVYRGQAQHEHRRSPDGL